MSRPVPADFWADTPARTLYCLLATEHVFSTPRRAQYLLAIRNELHRRGLPLTPDGPGCACLVGGSCESDPIGLDS